MGEVETGHVHPVVEEVLDGGGGVGAGAYGAHYFGHVGFVLLGEEWRLMMIDDEMIFILHQKHHQNSCKLLLITGHREQKQQQLTCLKLQTSVAALYDRVNLLVVQEARRRDEALAEAMRATMVMAVVMAGVL